MKIISSPVKAFPGTVAIPEHLVLPQCLAFEKTMRDITALQAESQNISVTDLDGIILPFLFDVVTDWKISGITTLETFPMTPRKATHDLIAWIYAEVSALYIGETEVPNS